MLRVSLVLAAMGRLMKKVLRIELKQAQTRG